MLADTACGWYGRLTALTDRLIATGQAERVDGQFTAYGTSELYRDVVSTERADQFSLRSCDRR